MTRFLDTLRQCFETLAEHRLRTALSILGVTIGIAAVIAISTISRGGNAIVYRELETFGLNSVWVSRDYNADRDDRGRPRGSGIRPEDVAALSAAREALGIDRVSPHVWTRGDPPLLRRGEREYDGNLIGVGPEYTDMVNDVLVAGRSLLNVDIANASAVALLAPGAVSGLFDEGETVIGAEIRIGSRRFLVVGLLAGKSRDFLASIGSSGGQDANDRVLLPYTALQSMAGTDDVNLLHLSASEFESADYAGQRVKTFLSQRRQDRFQFRYETMAQHIATADRILGGVAVVGMVAASVSLLVGGMGIMNMMGTAVLERTREIGIRKAIGARERDILMQFLLEACVISVIGGLLGLLIGGGASVLLAALTGFPLLPSWRTIAFAMIVSLLLGVLSGYLPARRAARLHPVQALRSE